MRASNVRTAWLRTDAPHVLRYRMIHNRRSSFADFILSTRRAARTLALDEVVERIPTPFPLRIRASDLERECTRRTGAGARCRIPPAGRRRLPPSRPVPAAG